ncbi:MAG: nonsense-mediated mRNA decay protein 5 [Amphiamblys sp. WSBS2006]|nr:MAG: nonsense-mediated mRNA decay protein 5 [Amphiamblys sp. WSBS2006]
MKYSFENSPPTTLSQLSSMLPSAPFLLPESIPCMNQPALSSTFSETFSPDATIRKNAEARLGELEREPGFYPLLVQLVAASELPTEIRTAAAIFLKNGVDKKWDEGSVILFDDRDKIRDTVFQAFCVAGPQFSAYFKEVVGTVIRTEFPDRWMSLLQLLHDVFQTQPSYLHTAVVALMQLIRKKKIRSALEKPCEESIDALLEMARQKGVESISHSPDTALLKAILKTYHTAIEYSLQPELQQEQSLSGWLGLVFGCLDLPVPKDDDDDSQAWKLKKWAWKIIDTLTRRYGIKTLRSFSGKKYEDFSDMFVSVFLPPVFEKTLQTAVRHASGEARLPARIYSLVCTQVSCYVKTDQTWTGLKDHLGFLIGQFLFPELSFSDADEEQWEDDPVEYVRTHLLDLLCDTYTAEESASYLLEKILDHRQKETLAPMLAFINQVFAQTGHPAAKDVACQKDGALNILGTIAPTLFKEGYKNEVKAAVLSVCVSELSSEFPFLKCRACWVARRVVDEIDLSQEEASEILRLLLPCIDAKEHLAVRVEAAGAIVSLTVHEGVREGICQHLPQIVQTLIELTDKTVSEILPGYIESLLYTFQAELSPYITQITEHIAHSIQAAIAKYAAPDEDTGTYNIEDIERFMGVQAMFKTIDTVIDATKMSPELLAHTEKTLFPVLETILARNIDDLIGDAVEKIETLLYTQKKVSEQMWTLLPRLCGLMEESPMEFAVELGTVFDNYLSYGIDTVVQNEQLGAVFFGLIQTYCTHSAATEDEIMYGCNMMESFMMRARNQIDDIVPAFVEIGVRLLERPDTPHSHQVLHVEVLLNAILYSPAIAFGQIDALSLRGALVEKWKRLGPSFTRVHDKKLAILAICTVLASEVAVSLSHPHLKDLADILAETHKTLPAALEKRKKILEDEDAYEDDSEGSCTGEESDDAQSDASENAYEDELEEEPSMETPIDTIDALAFTKETFKRMEKTLPALFGDFGRLLPPGFFGNGQ